MKIRSAWLVALNIAGLLASAHLSAQSALNMGSELGPRQSRGSAWVARADDPIAAFANPAGMVRQRGGIHMGMHFMGLNRCFTRQGPGGVSVSPGGGLPAPGSAGGPPAEVCVDNTPFLNPQMAAVIPVGDRMRIGLAMLGAHSIGIHQWPEVVSFGAGRTEPAPNRFSLVRDESVLAYPTVSIGFAVSDKLALGAGLNWSYLTTKGNIFMEGVSPPQSGTPSDNFFVNQEIKVTATGHDYKAPGFVLGALYSASPTIDLGGWFHWNSTMDPTLDIHLESRYFNADGSINKTPCAGNADPNCNITEPAGTDGTGFFKIPTELHTGIRYHRPRVESEAGTMKVSEPLLDDRYDIEMDLVFAHNGAIQQMPLTLDIGGQQIKGITGTSTLPDEVHVIKHWKNTYGVRVGGEYVVKQGQLALRAGASYNTKSQEPVDISLHFDMAQTMTASVGAMLRLGRFDVTAGVQRTQWADLDNGGNGAGTALSGEPSTNHNSRQIMNGGLLTSYLNEMSVSATYRFGARSGVAAIRRTDGSNKQRE